MKYKKFINEYLSFTKKETKGVIVLLTIIVIIFLLPLFFPFFINHKANKMDDDFIAAIKALKADSSNEHGYKDDYYNDYSVPGKYKKNAIIINPHPFDPNTISESGWIQMGIRPKTAATIRNYISKGGKFKSPEDLRKIYGLSPEIADKLIPFITIVPNEKDSREIYASRPYLNQNYPSQNYKTRVINSVNINLADTSEWIALPGIGSKLSQRIIAFRDKLGGFYSIDQVGETFLLPDSTFQKIKPFLIFDNSPLKKININLASLDEMKIHPYLRYNIANVIVQYRNQHGDFKNISDVKKIVIITDEIYNKVAPYLTLN
ncbi:MAG: helix-hairpin-helix domain-containing protein [Ginsengibacter sp.]